MQINWYKKGLVIGIILFFIGASLSPEIYAKINVENKDISTVTLFAVGGTSCKENKIEISTNDAKYILNQFNELKKEITLDPCSEKAAILRNNFVSILEEKEMLPMGVSKDEFINLLRPPDIKKPQGNNIFSRIYNLKKTIINPLFIKITQIFENRLNSINPPIESYDASATLNFCTIASYGDGYTIPVMIPPRPRIGIIWNANYSETYTGEVFSKKAIYAEGQQSGSTVGFTGGGGTFAFPGAKFYVFVGYTWHVTISADHIDFYPPNQPPVISNENPPNGAEGIPLSLSELSFRISDLEGEKMDYTVTTEPDIGTGSATNKGNGVYSVPVSGLEYDKMYTWTVELTEGNFIVEKKFIFFTPLQPPFDPFDEGWQYRKKITIDHNMVDGDLVDFPVLISVIDSDIKNKAQDDGDDILFMDDIGVASKMFHEIERYDSSSGELVAWVRVPSLSSNVNTNLYIYYGNLGCSSQQYPARVWDSNYKAVYHMNYGSGGLVDSTSNDNDCNTVLGSPDYNHLGKIGYAINFEKSMEEAFEGGDILDGFNELTVEAWINFESYHSSHCMIVSHEDAWYFHVQYQYDAIVFDVHGGVSGSGVHDDINCPLGVWYYAAGTWSDPHDRMRLYTSGELKDTYIETLSMQNSPDHFAVGYQDNNGKYFDGAIDEIRVSDKERSEEWIKTTYLNQNNPSSFFSVGPEET